MKTKFRHCVKGFNGKMKAEGLVYCKYNDGALYLTRRYPIIELQERHKKFGAVNSNLKLLFESFSDEYKKDLANYSKLMKSYTDLSEKLTPSNYAFFIKQMWALKKMFPEIELVKITRVDILKHEYPMRTVVEAMNSGLLLKIEEASILNNNI